MIAASHTIDDDRPSVLFCSPGMAIGGAEQWVVTLAKHFRRLRPLGCFVTSPIYSPLLIQQANAIGFPFLSVPVTCDVILTWGISTIRKYLGPTMTPIVEVAHSCPNLPTSKAHLEQACCQATHLAAVSEAAKRSYPAEWQSLVQVVENGVDRTRLEPKNGAIEKRGTTVVQVGRLSPEKRPQKLVEAAAHLPKSWTVIFVGDGPLLNECVELANKVAKCRVIFAPSTDDVGAVYQTADVLCITSQTEGLPTVMLEAWLSNVPVVSTAYVTAVDLCDRYGSGMMDLVPLDVAPRRLAKALRKAVGRRTDKARRVAIGRYTAAHMAERWEEYLLGEVLEI